MLSGLAAHKEGKVQRTTPCADDRAGRTHTCLLAGTTQQARIWLRVGTAELQPISTCSFGVSNIACAACTPTCECEGDYDEVLR